MTELSSTLIGRDLEDVCIFPNTNIMENCVNFSVFLHLKLDLPGAASPGKTYSHLKEKLNKQTVFLK